MSGIPALAAHPGTTPPPGLDWIHPAASVTEHAMTGTRVLTAADLCALAEERTADWASLGAGPGDRVVVATGSRLSTLLDLMAAWQLDLVPVLLSDQLAPESYRILAEATGARAARGTPAVARSWGERAVVVRQDNHSALAALTPPDGGLCGSERQLPLGEPALVLATSGSTGLPKAVVHSRANLLRNAQMHWNSVGAPGPEGRYLLSQSMHFSSALVCGVLGVLARGMQLALMEPPFSTSNWFAAAREHETTHTALTPHLLLRVLDGSDPLPTSLRQITVGGDRLGRTALGELRGRGVPEVFSTYGLTEAGPRVATNPLGRTHHPEGLGTPLAGVRLELRPTAGTRDGMGELVVHTPTAQLGTYRDGGYVPYPLGGEVPTGDLGERLDNGGIRLVGRSRRVASVNGEKIYLGLVERVLAQHPDVVAARVEPDPEAATQLAAEILYRPGVGSLDATALRRWCRGRLRAVEVPRRFTAVDAVTRLSK
ncbi:class I adenylate-forming enzyme family protein [Streptomyces sp. NPDC058221]|uniref:class I adenylate-forming enzyme family protein n=1 Tax=Streptomyces sp. NPDC058221 TaxID=3346388 RepID=UPI0036EDD061